MSFDHLDQEKFADEREALAARLAARPLSLQDRAAVQTEAEALVRAARKGASRQGVVESFLQEFSLSTREVRQSYSWWPRKKCFCGRSSFSRS